MADDDAAMNIFFRTHKICDIRILDLVDQNLSKFGDFGVFGKLRLRSIQIDD